MDNIKNRHEPIAVNIIELQEMLGVSKNTALKIATDADAIVHLGIRRTLYNVEAIKKYIDSLTGAAAS